MSGNPFPPNENTRLIVQQRGPIKLEKQDDTYLVMNGTKVEKQYTSQTWAVKKYDRLTRVFTKE